MLRFIHGLFFLLLTFGTSFASTIQGITVPSSVMPYLSAIQLDDKTQNVPENQVLTDTERSTLLGLLKDQGKVNALIQMLENYNVSTNSSIAEIVSNGKEISKLDHWNFSYFFRPIKKQLIQVKLFFSEDVSKIDVKSLKVLFYQVFITLALCFGVGLVDFLLYRLFFYKRINKLLSNVERYTFFGYIFTNILVIFGASLFMGMLLIFLYFNGVAIYPLFVILFIFLFLTRLINIFFHNYKIQNRSALAFWTRFYIGICFIFLFMEIMINDVFLKEGIHYVFSKINLLVFYTSFMIPIFILKNRLLKNCKKYQNEILKHIMFYVQKYGVLVMGLIFLSLFWLILLLDYAVTISMLEKIFISLLIGILLYLGSLFLYFLIYKKIIMKIEIIFRREHKKYDKSLLSYNILSLSKVQKFFSSIYLLLISFLFLFLIDIAWGVDLIIISNMKYFLNTFIINILVSVFSTVIILYGITFFILLYLNNKVIGFIESESFVRVNKLLTLVVLLKKPYIIFMYIIVIIAFVSSLGLSIKTILASTGIVTILVAFGAKDILKNLFNGIIFFLEDGFSLNDIVEISGKTGTVENISLIYVRIRDIEGRLHLIPFSSIDIISNMSKDFSYALIDVGIGYESNIENVKDILTNMVVETRLDPYLGQLIVGDCEFFGVITLSDYTVQVRFRVKTIAGRQYEVKRHLLLKVKEVFEVAGIKIPYPHSVVILEKE